MIAPDRLRRLDRFVGVPACAVLTALRRAAARLGRGRAPGGAPRRVLFVQLAESGSMVLADAAMREAARCGAELFCLTFAHNRASLALTAAVGDANVFALRAGSGRELVADACRFLRWVRVARIDAIVDLELFSRLTAALGALTGVRRRAGFHRSAGVGAYRGDLYSAPLAFDPQLHVAHNYLRLVRRLVGVPPEAPADLRPRRRVPVPAASERVRHVVAARFAPWGAAGAPGGSPADGALVLLNANASALLPQRRWPRERFVALARRLLAHSAAVRVLLIGAAEDADCARAIAADVADPRCVEAAGLFDLAELPALFEFADVMVSNDSGPAHFAAVTALPVIALFGPETPVLFRPLGNATVFWAGLPCSPCVSPRNQRRSDCADNRCMRAIGVDAVFGATVAVLDATGGADGRPDPARGPEVLEA